MGQVVNLRRIGNPPSGAWSDFRERGGVNPPGGSEQKFAPAVDRTLWPEYLDLKKALDEYLNEATERIIREEVYSDAREAPERAG